MSASSIPYHLRQNKAIDRGLFLDLLSRVGRFRNISEYVYVGFGGPFLEDFRAIHSSLRISEMISIEVDANTFARQRFNLPVSCIELRRASSEEFISDFDFSADYVVWLDYTEPAKLGVQLAELHALVSKLPDGSVFKVTLNASPSALGNPNDGSDLQEFRAKRLKLLLGDYAPVTVEKDDVTTGKFPETLLRAVERAAKEGMAGRKNSIVQPLTCFSYKDGQQMFTFSAIILRRIDQDPFLAQSRLRTWPFAMLDWLSPTEVGVPAMSFKERMYVESRLPEADAPTIQADMAYYIGENSVDAEAQMANFVRYYRVLPWYSRVLV